jgi:hypothetical protein
MDKIFAIQRPDGTIVMVGPPGGDWPASECVLATSEDLAWQSMHDCDDPVCLQAVLVDDRTLRELAESLGYRCVEVEVVKKEVKP